MPRRILVVDQTTTHRIILRAKLTAAGYDVDLAGDLATARKAITCALPDVVMIAATHPDPDALNLRRSLGGHGRSGRIPVILLDDRDRPALPGPDVDAVVKLPTNDAILLARLRSVLRIHDLEEELASKSKACREMGLSEAPGAFAAPVTIVFSPDQPGGEAGLNVAVGNELKANIAATSMTSLLSTLDLYRNVDAVVLDYFPGKSGQFMQIISDLRCRAQTRQAAIILRFPRNQEDAAAMALDLGASEVIIGNPDFDFLAGTIARELEKTQKLKFLRDSVADGLRMAITDSLTGLFNRRYGLSHLEEMARESASSGRPLSVVIVDIDRFKHVNDTYGHQAGDSVLVAVSDALRTCVSGQGLVSRFGGEEFMITLPNTDVKRARAVAEDLRRHVANLSVALPDRREIGVTLSAGLTSRVPISSEPCVCADRMIGEADRALYRAKSDGRNQVIVQPFAA